MEMQERSDLRKAKLIELYDYYFENDQEAKSVIQEIKQDAESRAAYDYLFQKGLIDYKEQKASNHVMFAEAKINVRGIDARELDKELR